MRRMSGKDRLEAVRMYHSGHAVSDIARRFNRSEDAIYYWIHRLRGNLILRPEEVHIIDSRGFSVRIYLDEVHIHNWDSILAGMVLRKAIWLRQVSPDDAIFIRNYYATKGGN